MLTADTITDEQIRLLAGSSSRTTTDARIVYHECRVALGYVAWASLANRRTARARCAEILNARAKESK